MFGKPFCKRFGMGLVIGVAAVAAALSWPMSAVAKGTKDCNATPTISNFQLSYRTRFIYTIPWVQQFSFDIDAAGGAGYVAFFDESGATGMAFDQETGAIGGDFVGSRGTRLWQPGEHIVHALVQTQCGVATTSLSFNFLWQQFDEPYAYGRLVVVGDSYPAGEGNPPFINSGPCHVSPLAWPSLMFDGRDGSTSYFEANLACSGARIDDLFRPFKGQSSQLDQLQKLGPDIATITIGGNDLHFGHLMRDCFFINCLSDKQYKAARADIRKLEQRLELAFGRFKAVVRRLYVVGYSHIFPLTQPEAVNCGWLTPRERVRFNRLTDLLDQTERQTAETIGAIYVSTLDALQGHELCSNDSWMYPIGKLPLAADGHPTPYGDQAISDVVEAAIDASS